MVSAELNLSNKASELHRLLHYLCRLSSGHEIAFSEISCTELEQNIAGNSSKFDYKHRWPLFTIGFNLKKKQMLSGFQLTTELCHKNSACGWDMPCFNQQCPLGSLRSSLDEGRPVPSNLVKQPRSAKGGLLLTSIGATAGPKTV